MPGHLVPEFDEIIYHTISHPALWLTADKLDQLSYIRSRILYASHVFTADGRKPIYQQSRVQWSRGFILQKKPFHSVLSPLVARAPYLVMHMYRAVSTAFVTTL
jgi:hypothetical protein